MVYLLIYLVIILGLYLFIKRNFPVWVGKKGEKAVLRGLNQLDSTYYKVLADLMLPSFGNTTATQIDFVVVSNYGIFCIEAKGTEGWIYGNAYDKSWTQVYFKYHQKLFNPLRQNFAHTKALEALLGPQYLKTPVVPLVIFTYADKINVTETDSVGNLTDSINKLKNYTQLVYTDIERDAIYDLLVRTNITDKELRKAHDKAVGKLKRLNTR